MRNLKTLAIVLSSVLILGACSSAIKLDDKASIEDRSGSADSRSVSTVTASSIDPLNDSQGVLASRSIYFDFDSYIVKEEFRPVVEAHAKYLVSNPARKIVVQGNSDERGGREYNLALGQKRAETVRKLFSLLGVSDQQVEAVSYGEEKPKATGSNEAAWSQNRRADIVY